MGISCSICLAGVEKQSENYAPEIMRKTTVYAVKSEVNEGPAKAKLQPSTALGMTASSERYMGKVRINCDRTVSHSSN